MSLPRLRHLYALRPGSSTLTAHSFTPKPAFHNVTSTWGTLSRQLHSNPTFTRPRVFPPTLLTLKQRRPLTTLLLAQLSLRPTSFHNFPTKLPAHQRGISASTKIWLRNEIVLACKLILYGSLALLLLGTITYIGLHTYLEATGPGTSSFFHWRIRATLHSAQHAAEWDHDIARAAGFLAEAIRRMDEEVAKMPEGWASESVPRDARAGYVRAVAQLAEWEEKLGYARKAAERWRVLVGFGKEGEQDKGWVGQDVRIKAAVKLGGLVDEGVVEGQGEEDAERWLGLGWRLALERAGVRVEDGEVDGVLPESLENPTADVLMAATELGVHYARRGRLGKALPVFLSVLRARQGVPETREATTRGGIADPCEIGKLMAYLGEVLWAAGDRTNGLGWVRKAVERVEGLVEERAACRDCALVAGRNEVKMLRKLMEEADSAKGKGAGWGLWKRGGRGRDRKGKEEFEKELKEAEERLVAFLQVRVARGM